MLQCSELRGDPISILLKVVVDHYLQEGTGVDRYITETLKTKIPVNSCLLIILRSSLTNQAQTDNKAEKIAS